MRRGEATQRNELFKEAGPSPAQYASGGQPAYDTYTNRQHMSNQELLHEAQTMHEDTTQTLQKGLKVGLG